MICQPCLTAGRANAAGMVEVAKDIHLACESCDCQHKTGGDWIAMKPDASLFRS